MNQDPNFRAGPYRLQYKRPAEKGLVNCLYHFRSGIYRFCILLIGSVIGVEPSCNG